MANWDNKFKKKYPPTDKKKRRQQHLVRWRRGEKFFLKKAKWFLYEIPQTIKSIRLCVKGWRSVVSSLPPRTPWGPCPPPATSLRSSAVFFFPLSPPLQIPVLNTGERFLFYYYILFFSPPQRQNGFKKTIRTIREAKTRRGEKDTKTHRKKGGRKRARSVVTGKGKDAINNPALV